MSNRGHAFVVEIKRKPGVDYASKAGDARRSGRIERGGAVAVAVQFEDRGSHIDARLGVVTVGTVTHDPNTKGYFWAIYLPGMPSVPRPAGDAGKARDAISHKVREWCEAAKLISVRAGK